MKSAPLLILLLLLARLAAAKATPYFDLVAATTQQAVTVAARAQGLGADKLHCTLTNRTAKELRLRVPPGLHFAADDAGAQDLFTFQEKLLVLAPHASREVRLWAFCMEKHDYGPSTDAPYTFRGRATRGLQPLGDSLQKYPALAENYGQMFVWTLTDAEPLIDIQVVPALQRAATNVLRYLSQVTGRKPSRVSAAAHARPSVKTFSKRIFLLYHSPTAQVASLSIFGPDGQLVREVFSNKALKPGVVHYTLGLNATVGIAEAPTFTVRLSDAAGQVLHEAKVTETTPELDVAPAQQAFVFAFHLAKPVKNAHVRIRLPDGTLVQDLTQLAYLPAGKFRYEQSFKHLRPPGTAFVVRLESEAGQLIGEQPIVADKP